MLNNLIFFSFWSLLILILKFKSIKSDESSFDCPMRQLAVEFAAKIQPDLSIDQLQEIIDALNGSPEKTPNCTIIINDKIPNINKRIKKRIAKSWSDIIINNNNNNYGNIYVDNNKGDDSNDGSIKNPLKTLHIAVEKSRSYGKDILKKIIIRKGRYYLNKILILTPMDNNLIITNYNNEKVEISGAIPLNNITWNLYKKNDDNINIYYTYLNQSFLKQYNISDITGLRINGYRGIRARYPNANPETDGFGSSLIALSWLSPNQPVAPEFEYYSSNYPIRDDYVNGYFNVYQAGLGGNCNNFSPAFGYWCSANVQGGGSFPYRIPTGLIYNISSLPHAPYKNASQAIIQAWRSGHWATWMFNITSYDERTQTFVFNKGGFQGGRGDDYGDEFFIENVFEELDNQTEWFYNKSTNILYYYNNKTESPNVNKDLFEITNLKSLIFLNGNQSNLVKNIIIRGITFRDTAYTFMDEHGLPSGGDWALQRTACITMQGTLNITIENNLFTRLDGNGIMVSGYNRNLTIYKNEFIWQGDTAIALWGNTNGFTFPKTNDLGLDISDGYDGTNNNQPRFTYIIENFVHELGIFEKQSSFFFQAKSCQTYLIRNIFFNGPRAGINFNDGFGGDNHIKENLLFNTCRESGDHGPFNSWDRQVYLTNIDNNNNTTKKLYDHIYNNFFIANYNSQEAVDNDDGSRYYKTYSNFFVYGENGLKSNFGGHSNYHYDNIYAYLYSTCLMDKTPQYINYIDYYYNNTCIIASNVTNYAIINCTLPVNTWPLLGNNSIYIPTGDKYTIGFCDIPEVEIQQAGLDLGTTISNLPDDDYILNMAKVLLNI